MNCSKDLFSRYVWFVDTISRYDGISRARLNELWMRSPLSDGNPLPQRTFYHYRRAIEECFNIDILCNAAGEYYIDRSSNDGNRNLTNWLLDNYAVNSAISDTSDIAARVCVEDIPSARQFLPSVLDSMRENLVIKFSYAGFNRSRVERDIEFQPWLVKLYKQRWYMLGLKVKSDGVRTYALDRVKELSVSMTHFELPDDVDFDSFFGNIIGITSSKAAVRDVRLKVTGNQIKYLRALPLHSSQSEEIHDDYSIFNFKLKLNYELVHEIIGYGASVTVLAPPELRIMVTNTLNETLQNYQLPQK